MCKSVVWRYGGGSADRTSTTTSSTKCTRSCITCTTRNTCCNRCTRSTCSSASTASSASSASTTSTASAASGVWWRREWRSVWRWRRRQCASHSQETSEVHRLGGRGPDDHYVDPFVDRTEPLQPHDGGEGVEQVAVWNEVCGSGSGSVCSSGGCSGGSCAGGGNSAARCTAAEGSSPVCCLCSARPLHDGTARTPSFWP